MEALEKLQQLLLDMEVPPTRLNVHSSANRLWLLDNLRVKNKDHRDYEEVIDLLEYVGS